LAFARLCRLFSGDPGKVGVNPIFALNAPDLLPHDGFFATSGLGGSSNFQKL
jgi:hypothetical protein